MALVGVGPLQEEQVIKKTGDPCPVFSLYVNMHTLMFSGMSWPTATLPPETREEMALVLLDFHKLVADVLFEQGRPAKTALLDAHHIS